MDVRQRDGMWMDLGPETSEKHETSLSHRTGKFPSLLLEFYLRASPSCHSYAWPGLRDPDDPLMTSCQGPQLKRAHTFCERKGSGT